MNSNVVGLSQAALTSPSSTVLLFEVNNDAVAVASYDEGVGIGYQVNGVQMSPVGSGLQNGLYDHIAVGSATPVASNPGIAGTTQYATGPIGAQYSTALPAASQFAALTGLRTDGSNYLCADGHVKWYKGEKVSGGVSASSATYTQTTNTCAPGAAACAAATGTGGLGTGTSYSLTQALTFSGI